MRHNYKKMLFGNNFHLKQVWSCNKWYYIKIIDINGDTDWLYCKVFRIRRQESPDPRRWDTNQMKKILVNANLEILS
jgi:hypothetical protein